MLAVPLLLFQDPHDFGFELTSFPLETTWPAALGFSERRALIGETGLSVVDKDRAMRRMGQWDAALQSFDTPQRPLFADWLDVVDCDEPTFLAVVGADPSGWAESVPPPDWVHRAKRWCETVDSPFAESFARRSAAYDPPELCRFLTSYVLSTADRVLAPLSVPNLPDEPVRLVDLQLDGLVSRSFALVVRTLIVDFHARQMTGQFSGATETERFEGFAGLLDTPDYRAGILSAFPVLSRQLDRVATRWIVATRLLVTRLNGDWEVLANEFGFAADSRFAQIQTNQGDLHRGGLAVAIITMSCGRKFVYKPRSLAVEHRVQDLFSALDGLGQTEFRSWKVIDKGDYGWVEFVANEPCTDITEVREFYRRVGHLLAVVYLIGATDLHLENIVAAGAYPVAIDFETILSPPLRVKPDVYSPFLPLIRDSVLASGLIPSGQGEERFDTGLGDGATTGTIHVSRIEQLRLERRELTAEPAQNIITLKGAPVKAADYVPDMLEGFAAAYRAFQSGLKGGVLGAALDALSRTEVRVLLRHTQTYSVLLQEAAHPQLLRDGLELDRHFLQLIRSLNASPFVRHVLGSELEDLRQGDIPWFGADPQAKTVKDSSDRVIDNVLEASGWANARQRWNAMSDEDMYLQMELIVGSFFEQTHEMIDLLAAAEAKKDGFRIRPVQEGHRPDSIPGDPITAAVDLVAKTLIDRAHLRDSRVLWFSMNSGEVPGLVGGRLDHGLGGIALFFAERSALTGQDPDFTALLCRSFRDFSIDSLPEITSIGGFDGVGGFIWAACRLHGLGRFDARDMVAACLARANDLIDADQSLDLYSGATGLGMAALSAHTIWPDLDAGSIADRCAARLVDTAIAYADGSMMWPTAKSRPDVDNPGFAGMAHGTAGIALFLMQMADLRGAGALREMADRAMAYERLARCVAEKNWKRFDPLRPGTAPIYQSSWCHGAPGIGLSRVAMLHHAGSLPHITRSALTEDLTLAMAALCDATEIGNHTLCHGNLGNMVIARTLGDLVPGPMHTFEASGRRIAKEILRGDAMSDLPFGMTPSGLMTGLAGMGYGMLRLIHGVRLPDVLRLELLHA